VEIVSLAAEEGVRADVNAQKEIPHVPRAGDVVRLMR
jgi:hypothetical protein